MTASFIAPHASHATNCLISAVNAAMICMNFAFLCHFPDWRRLRYAYLAISGPVALALVPFGIDFFARALCVQVAGGYFIVYLRAIEYCLLEDPCPTPRSYRQYALAVMRDVYLPFERNAVANRPFKQPRPSPGAGDGIRPVESRSRQGDVERQPLAGPSDSYLTAVARLIVQLVSQYMLYDCLLTLCVKPLGEAAPPPLLSANSLQASAAFTVSLYLHFAMMYKGAVLALSMVHPVLLYRCRHLFREPWRGLMSVSELWQRWHQLFRLTFVRLAYRPARATVRRLLSSRSGEDCVSGGGAEGRSLARPKDEADSRGGGGSGSGSCRCSAVMEEIAALMAVFTLSGIIHEYMCWAAFGVARGWQMAFFLAHGIAILLEHAAAATISRLTIRGNMAPGSGMVPVLRVVLSLAAAAFCFLSSVIFMRPWIEAGYHRDFWHPVSPVAWALRQLAGGQHIMAQ